MIYIKTHFGWFSTGCDYKIQLKDRWRSYAISYWDSSIDNFIDPDNCGKSIISNNSMDVTTKLQMWTLGKEFRVFDENIHIERIAQMNQAKFRFSKV